MKFINKIFFVSVTGALLLMTSCSRNNDTIEPETAKPENDFVWRGLNSWYYWQKDVSKLADDFKNSSGYTSFINSQTPDALFYSLLYKYNEVDRNSWIVSDVDKLLAGFGGVSKSTGMDFTVYYKDPVAKSAMVAIVNYVVPNSPASVQGIKRGDVIVKVNGANLNAFNYGQLLNDNFTVTFAQSTTGDTGTGIITTTGEKNTVSITAIENLVENPVAYHQTITQGSKKIGYLVYNAFQANYDSELNNAIGDFKNAGVTDLILDLRYNGGGAVNTAVSLGQMVTGQFTGQRFVNLDFNSKHPEANEEDNFKTTLENGSGINSLNLSRVYVLTSGGTASASELTIKCLRPYISVITIGSETYGKFVGSITLFDSPTMYSSSGRNPAHNWAMQPITFAYYNSLREANPASGGLTADYGIQPAEYAGKLKEFGDVASDAALSKAIGLITGQAQASARNMASARSGSISNLSGKEAFVASRKTLMPFGTEVYIQPKK
ncbi:peptidase S41 [Elizabethkingia meningoseptica]|uniref:S41 family peptidase n=1 Tax=Elizabethkingia meningoseptica TaxID=238 RepID=UPI000998F73F|nr:S41 family peptidase [Elizabethkingia meningoseptica]OPB98185.1 peptidase S41 [Elizabethkingia meningoseptica]